MFSFTVEMDLSSLEGPPIHIRDQRPSVPSWGGSVVPHIQLDTSVLSPSLSETDCEPDWDRGVSRLPPRPASTDPVLPVPRHHHRYSTIETNSFRSPGDYLDARGSHYAPMNNHAGIAVSSPRPQSSHSSHPALPHHGPPPSSHASPSLRRPSIRHHSHSVSSPHQLVWLDTEKIWVLTTPAPVSTPGDWPSRRPLPPPIMTNMNTPATSNIYPTAHSQPTTLPHTQSMETYFANNDLMSPDYDDLPPPYGQHMYDQQLASGAGVSRWTAVARRVHGAPF
ncbi:hypothetical protein FE257_010668 [Aspergillus nanangensis]|uniref:Uncharacterized protein n=1 Tax=Aspergillus nanangensis TaxID=2582783 RepID=A0AAD4CII5_ASPNN|nr:hypothetical protein FE257_010668 [Aspergillus nanangensis]